MRLIMVMLIAISLSMDAFSLSLAYGTLNLEKKIYKFIINYSWCISFLYAYYWNVVWKWYIIIYQN